MSFFTQLLPASHVITSGLPSLESQIQSPHLFGMKYTNTRVDFESEGLGAARFFHHGSCQVLVVEPSKVVPFLPEANKTNADAGSLPGRIAAFVRSMTPQISQQMAAKNVNINHGTIDSAEKAVLVTPPGAMVFYNPLNNVNVGAVRITFLSFGQGAQREYNFYKDTKPQSSFAEGVSNLILLRQTAA